MEEEIQQQTEQPVQEAPKKSTRIFPGMIKAGRRIPSMMKAAMITSSKGISLIIKNFLKKLISDFCCNSIYVPLYSLA